MANGADDTWSNPVGPTGPAVIAPKTGAPDDTWSAVAPPPTRPMDLPVPVPGAPLPARPVTDAPQAPGWGGLGRAFAHALDVYQSTPSLLAPQAEDWLSQNLGGVGRAINWEAQRLPGTLAFPGALLEGVIGETAGAVGQPALGRDINLGLQMTPAIAAETRMMPSTYYPEALRTPATITTSAQAKAVANAAYKAFDDASGGVGLPYTFANDFLDASKNIPGIAPSAKVTGSIGTSAAADRLAALETQLRGLPISLQEVNQIDQGLGQEATNLFKSDPNSSRMLLQMQRNLRDQLDAVNRSDLPPGSVEAFDALDKGRQAYAASMRIQDVEDMASRASMTDNPASSLKSQIRNYVMDPANTRGWTDAEVDALKRAASTGMTGEALRTFGSRLMPIAAAAEGGLTGGLATGVLQSVISGRVRDALTNMQMARMQRAQALLGARVPTGPPLPRPPLDISGVASLPVLAAAPGPQTGTETMTPEWRQMMARALQNPGGA